MHEEMNYELAPKLVFAIYHDVQLGILVGTLLVNSFTEISVENKIIR